MKLCFEYKDAKLEVDEDGYKVSLGLHSNNHLTYEQAAYELGEVIMFILESNGDLFDEDLDD